MRKRRLAFENAAFVLGSSLGESWVRECRPRRRKRVSSPRGSGAEAGKGVLGAGSYYPLRCGCEVGEMWPQRQACGRDCMQVQRGYK